MLLSHCFCTIKWKCVCVCVSVFIKINNIYIDIHCQGGVMHFLKWLELIVFSVFTIWWCWCSLLGKKLNLSSWHEKTKRTFQISSYLTDNEIRVGGFILKLIVWSYACGFVYVCACVNQVLRSNMNSKFILTSRIPWHPSIWWIIQVSIVA